MSDALIMRRGGSGSFSPNNAVLHINAPAGCTITLAKGGVTVKVLDANKGHTGAEVDTLADWYYSVNPSNYGVWSVTASDGTNTVSASVTIDTNKQYDVELTYELYLIKDGVLKTPFTLSGMYQRNGAGWVEFYTTGGTYQKVYAQLTDEFLASRQYTKLIVEVLAFDYYGSFGIAVSGTDTNYEAKVTTPLTGATYPSTLEVDIFALSLSGKYFKIYWNSYPRTVRLKNVYLKR